MVDLAGVRLLDHRVTETDMPTFLHKDNSMVISWDEIRDFLVILGTALSALGIGQGIKMWIQTQVAAQAKRTELELREKAAETDLILRQRSDETQARITAREQAAQELAQLRQETRQENDRLRAELSKIREEAEQWRVRFYQADEVRRQVEADSKAQIAAMQQRITDLQCQVASLEQIIQGLKEKKGGAEKAVA